MTSVEVVGFLVKRLNELVDFRVVIDDVFFRLHHAWTCPVMVMFVFLCLLYRLLEPISCIASTASLPEKTLNAYCLMQNTFILPDEIARNVGQEVSHQGIDNSLPGKPKVYQKYYQWVPILLLAQAILFYAGRFLWAKKERGLTKNLLLNLDQQILKVQGGDKLMAEEDVEARVSKLASFLTNTFGEYRSYFVVYLACSVINLLNVCLQIVFTDLFLDASFFEQGWQVLGLLNMEYTNRTDPMVAIFPRMAKCQFSQYGPGGSVQTHDILCVLPFNFFYEMIFVYNLLWFTLLAFLSFLALLFWTVNFFSLRARVMSLELWKSSSDSASLKDILKKGNTGDWFVLRLLAVNMSVNHYRVLLKKLKASVCDDTFEPLISSTSKKEEDM